MSNLDNNTINCAIYRSNDQKKLLTCSSLLPSLERLKIQDLSHLRNNNEQHIKKNRKANRTEMPQALDEI
ncbi:unnamed protein product [Rotaria sordida]|uniref:Uncharacterized protein n=1 Tax=Rotaria sordida TaxID=392033 RepID=A0A815B8S4_9BILA|nr:unnamed protein product [Rotaria sordida]